MEEVRNGSSTNVGAETDRSPNIHRLHTATIVHSEKRVVITKYSGACRIHHRIAVDVSCHGTTVNECPDAVTNFGSQAADSNYNVRAEAGVQELTLPKIPRAVQVI